MRCERNCVGFRDWTVEHFHADDRAAVVVYHTPEQRLTTLTMHEAWGVDAFGQTTFMPTADEAVSFASRRYKAVVSLAGRLHNNSPEDPESGEQFDSNADNPHP